MRARFLGNTPDRSDIRPRLQNRNVLVAGPGLRHRIPPVGPERRGPNDGHQWHARPPPRRQSRGDARGVVPLGGGGVSELGGVCPFGAEQKSFDNLFSRKCTRRRRLLIAVPPALPHGAGGGNIGDGHRPTAHTATPLRGIAGGNLAGPPQRKVHLQQREQPEHALQLPAHARPHDGTAEPIFRDEGVNGT